MKKLVLAFACIGMLGASYAAKADKWGTAGCGVGSLIFEDKPGKIQLLAATTNDMFYQSSSITSGTSNCTDMNAREEAALFITVNKDALRKDISRGDGETLAGLSKVLRCADAPSLGSALQKNYRNIFPSENTNADQVIRSLDATIRTDRGLSKTCALYS